MLRLTLLGFGMLGGVLLGVSLDPTTARAYRVVSANSYQQSTTQTLPTPKTEGCVSCHGQIEPMHKYGTTDTLEKLKDGKDAVGLTCTACHGGNPAITKTSDDPQEVERVKRQAHVQPKFPTEWRRNGRYTGANPERSNTLLARESWEFVRFINPSDLRVVSKTCAGTACADRRLMSQRNCPNPLPRRAERAN